MWLSSLRLLSVYKRGTVSLLNLKVHCSVPSVLTLSNKESSFMHPIVWGDMWVWIIKGNKQLFECTHSRWNINIFSIWCEAQSPHENEQLFSWIWKKSHNLKWLSAFQRDSEALSNGWKKNMSCIFKPGLIAFLMGPMKFTFGVFSMVSAYAAPKWPRDYGKGMAILSHTGLLITWKKGGPEMIPATPRQVAPVNT